MQDTKADLNGLNEFNTCLDVDKFFVLGYLLRAELFSQMNHYQKKKSWLL